MGFAPPDKGEVVFAPDKGEVGFASPDKGLRLVLLLVTDSDAPTVKHHCRRLGNPLEVIVVRRCLDTTDMDKIWK